MAITARAATKAIATTTEPVMVKLTDSALIVWCIITEHEGVSAVNISHSLASRVQSPLPASFGLLLYPPSELGGPFTHRIAPVREFFGIL